MQQNPKLTPANYDRVQVGMTEAQLLDTLSQPTMSRAFDFGGRNRKSLHYNGNGVIGIITVENGVVIRKIPTRSFAARFPGGAGLPGMQQNDKLTQANYDRVRVGMTEAQVHDLLGKPTLVTENFGGPNRKALHYNGNGVLGIIVLNNGVVESK